MEYPSCCSHLLKSPEEIYMQTETDRFIESLLLVSEKCANIVRACREDPYLLFLLKKKPETGRSKKGKTRSRREPKDEKLDSNASTPEQVPVMCETSQNLATGDEIKLNQSSSGNDDTSDHNVIVNSRSRGPSVSDNDESISDEKSLLAQIPAIKEEAVTGHFFKTVVDILVQQVIRHEIGKKYPEMKHFIYGKEKQPSVVINGKPVPLKVCDNEAINAIILSNVLGGDEKAGKILAEKMHVPVSFDDIRVTCKPKQCQEIPINNLGIWINPVDAAEDFIGGSYWGYSSVYRPPDFGLPCVSIMIGAFHRDTGEPIIGVINQPFSKRLNEKWEGRCSWGVSYEDFNACSIRSVPRYWDFEYAKVISVRESESTEVIDKLIFTGFTTFIPTTIGYSMLCVAFGIIKGFMMTKETVKNEPVYYWDTCAAHAILRAQGGGVMDLSTAYNDDVEEIGYRKPLSSDLSSCRHFGGIIACGDTKIGELIAYILTLPNIPNENTQLQTMTEEDLKTVDYPHDIYWTPTYFNLPPTLANKNERERKNSILSPTTKETTEDRCFRKKTI